MKTFNRLSQITGLAAAVIAAIAATASCQKPDTASLTIDSLPSQILAEGGSTTFALTASGTWAAAIKPADDGSTISWLTIEPSGGNAGQHNVTLTAEANTGAERTAAIEVTCGTTSFTVSATQAAAETAEDPEEPGEVDHTGLVKSLTLNVSSKGDYIYEFSYDEQNRVSELIFGFSEDRSEDYRFSFTYGEGYVTIDSDDIHDVKYDYDVLLDENGRATKLTSTYEGTYTFTYDDSGRLIHLENNTDNATGYNKFDFTWSNGCIIRLDESDNNTGKSHYMLYNYAKEYENIANIDINWLLTCGHGQFFILGIQHIGMIDLLGSRSANYALPFYSRYAPTDYTFSNSEDLQNMNSGKDTTVTTDVTDILEYSECIYEYKYTDGKLTNISATIPKYTVTFEGTGKLEYIDQDSNGYYYSVIFDPATVKEIARTKTGSETFTATISYY